MPKVVRHKVQFGPINVLRGKTSKKYHVVYGVLFSMSQNVL